MFNVQEVWTDQYLSNLLPVETLCQGMDAIQALYRILLVTLVKAQGLQSLLNTYRGAVQCTQTQAQHEQRVQHKQHI